MKFEEMGIDENIINILEREDIKETTEIQKLAIPLIKEGKDVIGQSETGSGKTLAFSIPIVEGIVGKGLQALILTPTRELANQIENEIRKISGIGIANIHGGVPLAPQARRLQNAQIVVATPGRMIDHMKRGNVDFLGVRYLVIDEAARMLDMGFIDDIEYIIRMLPKERQTMMFSATIPYEVERLSRYMKNATIIITKRLVDASSLEQYYVECNEEEKKNCLKELVKNCKKCLVFANTRVKTDRIAKFLQKEGINARSIHGGLSQSQRDKAMELFRKEKINVLVATDVASRGIDVKGISYVFNYDVPRNSEDYIHRIGRTARAGNDGKAITLLASHDHNSFRKIIRRYKLNIKKWHKIK